MSALTRRFGGAWIGRLLPAAIIIVVIEAGRIAAELARLEGEILDQLFQGPS